MNRKTLDLLAMVLITGMSAGAQRTAPAARRVPSSPVIASVGPAEFAEAPRPSVLSLEEPRLPDGSQAPPHPAPVARPFAFAEAPEPPEPPDEPQEPLGAPRPRAAPAGRAAARAELEEAIKARVLARAGARRDEGLRREDHLYQQGSRALDQHQWERAIERFDQVVQLSGSRADGALYWKAYAQNKQADGVAALATLGELQKSFPKSLWLNDAKALEVEVRQAAGHPVSPEKENDEELQLMALNGLMNSDPDRALPVLEKYLQSSHSPKLKEHALFVLTQGRSAQARDVVARIAKGGSNPDLQVQAINYLGMFGGKDNRALLAEIYSSSADRNVKRTVLHSYMMAGDRAHVLAAAQSEKDESLRQEAIHQLGVMGGQAELWQLYQQESSAKTKETILRSMFTGGNTDKLTEVARTERDPTLRRAAIHNLGLMGPKSGDALGSIYAGEQDKDVRKEILGALFIQGNAHALVEIARKETDPELKKQVVSKLSIMRSKEATDYLMELLNK